MDLIKKIIEFLMDILETVVFMSSILIVTVVYIIQPQQVVGASMQHSFEDSDRILASKIAYKFEEPKRHDVIVFKAPRNKDVNYIKRVIGVPGDRIMINDNQVYVNGIRQDEPYISSKTILYPGWYVRDGLEITIPENYVFAMGDNRSQSSDCREFGPVPMDDIVGKVVFRLFPISGFGSIN
jgi:signal peptidase I